MNSNLLPTLLFIFITGTSHYIVHGQIKVNPSADDALVTETDRHFIKKVYQIARTAAVENYPYGALLVHGVKIIAECGNRVEEMGKFKKIIK
ncbi:MAG: hypothetical protein ACFCUL_06830 [Flavobacteriaceae bacterium]